MADWQSERRAREERLDAGSKFAEGKIVVPDNTTALLEAVIRPGDRICLEGDNQKQTVGSKLMSRHGPSRSAWTCCAMSVPTSTVRRSPGQALLGSAVGSPGLAMVTTMVHRSGPPRTRSVISCSRKSGPASRDHRARPRLVAPPAGATISPHARRRNCR
jgi:Malonate decarboxylase, alpha subunit, transporter